MKQAFWKVLLIGAIVFLTFPAPNIRAGNFDAAPFGKALTESNSVGVQARRILLSLLPPSTGLGFAGDPTVDLPGTSPVAGATSGDARLGRAGRLRQF